MGELIKRQIEAAEPRERDYWLYDAKLAGFAVRVWPSGKKVFTYEYRPAGSTTKRKVTIGTFGAITVDQARDQAKVLAGQIVKGENPAEAKRSARRGHATEKTVNELLDAFMVDREAKKKIRTVDEYRRLLNKDVRPKIGAKRLSHLERADVSALHRAMSDRPYMANNTLKTLRAAFAFGIAEGMLSANPAAGIELYPEEERDRFLTDDEFTALGDSLRHAESDGVPVPEVSRKRKGGEAKARKAKRTEGEAHGSEAWALPEARRQGAGDPHGESAM
jgi:hypothetical protein